MWPFGMTRREMESFLLEYSDELISILLDAYGTTVGEIVMEHMSEEAQDWAGDYCEAGVPMDWTKKMTRKDLVRFLETMYRELAEDAVYFAPAFVRAFCDEHEDQITAFIRRWENELEGEYDDIV